MTTPWLSVLVPTLNGTATLAETLASVAANDDPGVELIVIDGGSTDATTDIVTRYQDRLRVTLVRDPASTGWTASTNQALAMARAPHACFLHQDDTWSPRRLATMKALMAEHPGLPLYTSDAAFIDARGQRVGSWTASWPGARAVVAPDRARDALIVHNFLSCPAPIFETVTARAVGGLDEDLWYTADWDFWLKLAARGGVAHVPEPLVGFRVHAGSLTVRGSAERPDFLAQMEQVVARHADAHGAPARIARFSNAVNAGLASALHGARLPVGPIVGAALRLGPADLARYLATARPDQRVAARLRAGVHA